MYKTFSNWILIWFFLFCYGLTTYNPIILLIIGYTVTFGSFIYIYLKNTPKENLIKYLIINVIFKFLFILIIIKNYSFVFSWDDVIIAVTLYISYLLLMVLLNENFVNHYISIFNAYIYNKPEDKSHLSFISRLYDNIYYKLYLQ